MDPITAAQTAWQIFNACYAAYNVVSQAIEVDAQSRRWDVQMRVERVRFEVWGRTLGFLDEETGSTKQRGSGGSAIGSGGLSEIVEVETANQLIRDLLQQISDALNDFREAAEKYSLGAKVQETADNPTTRREKAAAGLSKAWLTTKSFSKHVVYVLTDKGLVEQLIQRLAGLNDSLEKLLTLSQKVQYVKAVSSGVLSKYREPEELDIVLTALKDGRNVNAKSEVLLASARVKQLCAGMRSLTETGPAARNGATVEQTAAIGSSKLSPNFVRGYQPTTKTRRDLHWPVSTATYTADATVPPRRVIIEWRQAKPSTPRFVPEKSQLLRRRDAIVNLLHQTSTMSGAGDYRLLDCLGYIEATAREDGQETGVVGFVSLVPDWADEQHGPVTLHSQLQDSFDNTDAGTVPSLRTRFRLARCLANALYQLQCSNWLHRNLSSHQVVFFSDKDGGSAPRLDRPYLIGLQYSRPDDIPDGKHRKIGEKNEFSEGFEHKNDQDPELYLPPPLATGRRQRRYRRSDDVYSLGVMLFEIALWEPVQAYHRAGNDEQDTARRVLETAEKELAAEVGELYADVVLRCLRGLRGDEDALSAVAEDEAAQEFQPYDGRYHGEDPEYGLEVDFFWKVLHELEKCRV